MFDPRSGLTTAVIAAKSTGGEFYHCAPLLALKAERGQRFRQCKAQNTWTVVEFLSLPPLCHEQWQVKACIRAVRGPERPESKDLVPQVWLQSTHKP